MRGSKIILLLLSLWLAVSAYFYLEHRVTVKTMDIPGWDLDENSQVIFKKIELVDKGRKTSSSFSEPTMRMQILNALPKNVNLQLAALNLLYFYSSPYTAYSKENWAFKLSGVCLKESFNDESLPKFKVFADNKPIYYHGILRDTGTNLDFFQLSGEGIDAGVSSIRIEWQAKNGETIVKTFGYPFAEQTLDFFRRGQLPDLSRSKPEHVLSKALWDYKNGKALESDLYSDQNILKKLEWLKGHDGTFSLEGLTYIGEDEKRKGRNLFSVELYAHSSQEADHILGQQVLYVAPQGEKWRIVEIDEYAPVNNADGQISFEAALAAADPILLNYYYRLTPQAEFKNGFFLVKQDTKVHLNRFGQAKRVTFKAAFLGTDAPPLALFTDENPDNGWSLAGSLPGQGGKIAVWAEVELEGELITTPLLPLSVEGKIQKEKADFKS